jgi:hypothetical protein
MFRMDGDPPQTQFVAPDCGRRLASMKRIGIALLYAIGGYIVAVFLSYFLVAQFSSNMHDRSVEAAMTSAFVGGLIGAVVAFIVGFVRSSGGPRSPG